MRAPRNVIPLLLAGADCRTGWPVLSPPGAVPSETPEDPEAEGELHQRAEPPRVRAAQEPALPRRLQQQVSVYLTLHYLDVSNNRSG